MFTKTAIILAAANLAAAHTTFQSFVIDGKDQGQHFAVQTPSNGNNPILDVTSTAMICNGGKATSDQVEVAAGIKRAYQDVPGLKREDLFIVSFLRSGACSACLDHFHCDCLT